MARKFRKRPDLHIVAIPGVGRLRENQVLEGDQYMRFVPHLLEEVIPAPEPAPAPMPEPEPVSIPVEPVPMADPIPLPFIPPLEEPAYMPAPSDPLVEEDAASTDDEDAGSDDEDAPETPAAAAPSSAGSPASVTMIPPVRKRGRPRKVRVEP